MQIQKKIVKKRNKAMIGKKLEVVVEGYHPESQLLMRGRYLRPVPGNRWSGHHQ